MNTITVARVAQQVSAQMRGPSGLRRQQLVTHACANAQVAGLFSSPELGALGRPTEFLTIWSRTFSSNSLIRRQRQRLLGRLYEEGDQPEQTMSPGGPLPCKGARPRRPQACKAAHSPVERERVGGQGWVYPSSDLTAATMWLALIPASSISCSGVAEPGI